jgi:hypothetical protein
MPEQPFDPKDAWRQQPPEPETLDARRLRWRTRELYVRTRMEIFSSVAAVLVLLGVVRFRDRIRLRPDHLVAVVAAHYKRELDRRRRHLRSAWIRHGPVVLAALTMASTLAGRDFANPDVLLRSAPFLALLAVWIVMGMVRRRAEARQLDEEIAEVDRATRASP